MSKFGFDKVKEQIEQSYDQLPTRLANQARNYFLDSFEKQSFNGQKWKEVQRREPGTKAYRWPSRPKSSAHSRQILRGRGVLRRKVRNSIREKSALRIRLLVDLPYAKRHNEGLDGMPQRQYMGQTAELTAMQRKSIIAFIRKQWRSTKS